MGVYVFQTYYELDGEVLGREAAVVYCTLSNIQRCTETNRQLNKDELHSIQLRHANLMRQGSSLTGSEKTRFTATYANMVAHCD